MGTANIRGTMSVYFDSHTLYTKFRNETPSVLSVKLLDPNTPTNGYQIVLPRIKHLGNVKDPGREGGVVQDIPFGAVYDSTEQASAYILKLP
jgi:hypothetical protein